VTVTNGTGEFKKAAGTGTLACTTTDLAHYTCTEKLKLVQQEGSSARPQTEQPSPSRAQSRRPRP